MDRWFQTTIGNFAPFRYGKGLPEKQRYSAGSVPVYGSNGLVGNHDTAFVRNQGIVVGRKGTIGSVHYSDVPFWPIDTTFYVEPAPHRDTRFTYYLLKTVGLENMNSDSAVPGLNRDAAHGRSIAVPPLDEQRAIASILGSLDDKIELNRCINKTLEEMARALFKSWFVDFDPVRARMEGRQFAGVDDETLALFPDSFEDSPLGEMPKEWSVDSLDEVAHFLNGLALQKYPPEEDAYLPAIKIAELRKGVTRSSGRVSTDIPPQYVVEDGDVLFSWSGSLEAQLWTGGRGALNQHLFKVTSERYPRWFYYYWIKQHLTEFRAIAADKATTMGHIKRHHLTDALVVVPPDKTLQKMTVIMDPLINKMLNNDLESRTLATIRDTLMPKLLSGQIRLSQTTS